jgi:hypothetical protein
MLPDLQQAADELQQLLLQVNPQSQLPGDCIKSPASRDAKAIA